MTLALACFHASSIALAAAQALPSAPPAVSPTVDPLPPVSDSLGRGEEETASAPDIVVTGVRASLSSAQSIKRNAQQIVDSVVAEDIGKLPDNNVVEALQRVPGVQVAPRFRGESGTVLIRGLPDVVTVINGRNIFSTTGRSLSLADVPADLVAGIDIYKSRSADQIEGGIAGLINVRTRRPFDFKGARFAVAARQVYSEQPDTIDPYASMLLSNRWSTGVGEIGALVSVSFHQTRYRDETIFNGGYFGYNADNSLARYTPGVPLDPRGTNPAEPRVFRSDVIGGIDTVGKRERPAVNASLQWAPSEELTLFADGLFYGFRDRGNADQNFTSMNGSLLAPLTFYEDTKLVDRLSVANNRVANYGISYQNKADRYQGAFGGEWKRDGWSIASEVSYTRSEATDRTNILDIDFIARRTDGFFDRSIGTPTFTLPFDDVLDRSKYSLARLNLTRTEALGEEYTWRGDVRYRQPLWIFTELAAGARINRRDATSRSFVQNVNCSATGAVRCYAVRADSIPGLLSEKPGNFFEGTRPFIRSWISPSTDVLLDNVDVLRQRFGLAAGDPAFQDTRFFDIKENSYAGYGQASFEIGQFDGQAGVRVVKVDNVSNAFRAVRTAVEPVRIASSTTDVLPNIALRYKLTDKLFLRAAASRTITRPSFAQLNPALTLTPPVPGQQPFGRGSSGNAELQPVKSTNYDLAVEWYIDRSSAITATFFHRKVSGFIQSVTSNFEIDYLGLDNGTYQISRPENSGSGKLTGIEGGFTFFPNFLSGVGISANGTYIDGKNRALAPLPGVTGFLTLPFANVSKYSATGTLIYEKNGLSARASYVWRDSYSTGLHFTGVNPNDFRNSPVENLDVSIAYDINPQFTIVFDATNITKNVFQTYFGDATVYPRDTVLFTRTFAIGFRARL
ncbi:TonB-dependent receptor [Sphingomonas sp. Leaf339]|uniref:TonB-dependent receptor n=1 Tax=Sphingomonas sp. Leaf339 TaxID=1736343 RepID=UPI0009EA0F21|nr:TonB-dependent receptor [Sphingomonas sp. Leaf339]